MNHLIGNKWEGNEQKEEGATGCISNRVASRGLTENLRSEKREAARGQEGWSQNNKEEDHDK